MCTEVGSASAGLAFQQVPKAETCHIWKAPNCACVSVWRRETLGLGQAPSGMDLLTCCHLLLRYHHLVTLSNKTSNCGPFEADCVPWTVCLPKGLPPVGLVAGPITLSSICLSSQLPLLASSSQEPPLFLPLFYLFSFFFCSQSSTF